MTKIHPLEEHGVIFIKYCSILLQALTIEADEDLLFAIYDLTQIKGASWDDELEKCVPVSGSLSSVLTILWQRLDPTPQRNT